MVGDSASRRFTLSELRALRTVEALPGAEGEQQCGSDAVWGVNALCGADVIAALEEAEERVSRRVAHETAAAIGRAGGARGALDDPDVYTALLWLALVLQALEEARGMLSVAELRQIGREE